MLGRAWQALLTREGVEHVAMNRVELDIASAEAIRSAITSRFDWVVNCAAWTAVDDAETQEEAATRINGHAVGQLVEACDRVGARLVHYSTDYVFSGQASVPYRTDQPRAPINAYGRSKAVGEAYIEQSAGGAGSHLLLRTSWLYAPWGKNFVLTIANAARSRDTLRVVHDQRGRPTSCEHLAETSARLMTADASGIHHVCDGGECTWYDFATAIAARVSPACRVDPCSSDEYPRPAPRPAYSVLDLTTTESIVGPMTSWQANLDRTLDQIA